MDVTFVTVHFGDPKWTSRLLESIYSLDAHPEFFISSVVVVDNARDGKVGKIAAEFQRCQVVTFPRNSAAYEKHGHDHHTSLQRAIGEVDCELLVVLDCDAHIIARDFLSYLHDIFVVRGFDAIAASDPRFEAQGLSHPCFMVFNRESRERKLPLDPTLVGNVGQTARLTRQFLESFGMNVYVPKRVRAFSGVLGDIYDDKIYHHGSATFVYSEDARLTKQVRKCEGIYAHAALTGNRYRLAWYEKVLVAFLSRLSRRSPRTS